LRQGCCGIGGVVYSSTGDFSEQVGEDTILFILQNNQENAIKELEMFGLLLGMIAFEPHLKNRRVAVCTDNEHSEILS
jgi:hypothetical protein